MAQWSDKAGNLGSARDFPESKVRRDIFCDSTILHCSEITNSRVDSLASSFRKMYSMLKSMG